MFESKNIGKTVRILKVLINFLICLNICFAEGEGSESEGLFNRLFKSVGKNVEQSVDFLTDEKSPLVRKTTQSPETLANNKRKNELIESIRKRSAKIDTKRLRLRHLL